MNNERLEELQRRKEQLEKKMEDIQGRIDSIQQPEEIEASIKQKEQLLERLELVADKQRREMSRLNIKKKVVTSRLENRGRSVYSRTARDARAQATMLDDDLETMESRLKRYEVRKVSLRNSIERENEKLVNNPILVEELSAQKEELGYKTEKVITAIGYVEQQAKIKQQIEEKQAKIAKAQSIIQQINKNLENARKKKRISNKTLKLYESQKDSEIYNRVYLEREELDDTINKKMGNRQKSKKTISKLQKEIERLEKQYEELEEMLYDFDNDRMEKTYQEEQVEPATEEIIIKDPQTVIGDNVEKETQNKVVVEPQEETVAASATVVNRTNKSDKQKSEEQKNNRIKIKDIKEIGLKFDNGTPYYYMTVELPNGQLITSRAGGFETIQLMEKNDQVEIKNKYNVEEAEKYYDMGMANFLQHMDTKYETSSFRQYINIMKHKYMDKKDKEQENEEVIQTGKIKDYRFEMPFKVCYDFSNLYKEPKENENKARLFYLKRIAKANRKVKVAEYIKQPNLLQKLWNKIKNRVPLLAEGKQQEEILEKENNISSLEQKRNQLLSNLKAMPAKAIEGVKELPSKAKETARKLPSKAKTIANAKFTAVKSKAKELFKKNKKDTLEPEVKELIESTVSGAMEDIEI